MCPTYTFIDRANGKFNKAMDFKREYSALIAAGWEIDQAYDKYLKSMDEDSYDHLMKLGLIDDENTPNTINQRMELINYLVDHVDKKHPFRKRYISDFMDTYHNVKRTQEDLDYNMWH